MKRQAINSRILQMMIATLLALVLVFYLLPTNALADDTEEESSSGVENDDKESEMSIDDMEAELNRIDEDKRAAQAEMDALTAQVEAKQEEVGRINQEVELKEDEIQRKQEEIEAQSKRIAEQQQSIESQYEGLGDRLRTMYKNGSIGFIDVLLGSSSFSELMSNIEMVRMIYECDKATLEDLHEHYNELKSALDELSDLQNQLLQAKDALLIEKDNAVAAQEELNYAVANVHEKIHELEVQSDMMADAIYAEQQRIEAEMERIREEARRKAEEEAKRKAEEAAKRKAEEEAKRAEEEAAIKEQLEELDAQIAEFEAQIDGKQAEVDEYAAAIESKQQEIDELSVVNTVELDARKKELEEQLALLRAELEEIEEEDEEAIAAKNTEIEGLQADIDSVQAEIDSVPVPDTSELEAEKAELESALETLQAELDELKAQMKAVVDERESISPTEKSNEDESDDESTYTDPFTYSGGALLWPVDNPYITSWFGYRPPEETDGIGTTDHGALDIINRSNPYGPIYASESGICTNYTGWQVSVDGIGYAAFIYHGEGVTTVYGHMSQLLVGPGDYVTKGQIIGYIGSTGFSTGPHLHFEVWVDGVKYDPLNFLQ